MNFVVFPVFFFVHRAVPAVEKCRNPASGCTGCAVNPFSSAVETLRFALYGQLALEPALVTSACAAVLLALAIRGYRPRQRV